MTRVPLDELDRATALMRGHRANRVLNHRIEPSWVDGGSRFRYRRDTADGHEYVVVDATSGERIVAPEEPGSCSDNLAILVSHDRRLGVFCRDGNLLLRDLDTCAERALTTDGAHQFGYGMPSDRYGQNKLARDRVGHVLAPVQTWWSPDDRYIVTARLDQRSLLPYPYLEAAPRDGSFRPKVHEIRLPLMGEPAGRLDWWVIDVADGARRPIAFPVERMIAANNGIDDLKVEWSGDGTQLLAISGMVDFDGAEAFAVDLATGNVRTIVSDTSSPGNPLVAGGYGRPIARFINHGAELLWWSQVDGWGHLYRYDTASGRLINRVTQGGWLVRDIVGVDVMRAQVWFTGMGREPGNPYNRFLYRIGLDGAGLTLASPEPGDHMIVDPTGTDLVFDGAGPTAVMSPDFAHYVYDVSSIAAPTQTILRRTIDGSRIAVIDQADASGLICAGYRSPQEFIALTSDGGATLYGLVYRPSDHDPARRYPIIDVEYGNPAVAITPRTYHGAAFFKGTAATPAALAELGFVVVVVDARGTPYRGRVFSHPGKGYLATMGLEDHIAFIRSVAASDPSLDLSRVGIMGQSFGGYTAIRALIEFPDFFKAAVAGAPQAAYHNMADEAILSASQGPPAYADGGRLRPKPTEVPLNFQELDCGAQLDRLKGHLLIVAGEQDENVYPGTIAQFMEKAIQQDKNVELISVPNAAHDALFTRYALRRSIDFMLWHLQARRLPDDVPELPSPAR